MSIYSPLSCRAVVFFLVVGHPSTSMYYLGHDVVKSFTQRLLRCLLLLHVTYMKVSPLLSRDKNRAKQIGSKQYNAIVDYSNTYEARISIHSFLERQLCIYVLCNFINFSPERWTIAKLLTTYINIWYESSISRRGSSD